MNTLDKTVIDSLLEQAKTDPRQRKSKALKAAEYPGARLLLNAMLPGTYIQPHRHNLKGTDEHWLAVVGKIAAISFEDDGSLRHYEVVSSKENTPLVSLPEKEYHTLIVIDNPAVILEITKGPYNADTYKEFASWAPLEEDRERAGRYLDNLTSLIKNVNLSQ